MKDRVRFVLASLAGAITIHIALVACSSSGSSSGGAVSSSDGGPFDAFVDALIGLVDSSPAHADPVGTFTQTEIIAEPCSLDVASDDNGTTVHDFYAVHAFPNMTAADLHARVTATTKRPTKGRPNEPPTYTSISYPQNDIYIKDGSVAVDCSSATDTAYIHLAK